MDFPRPVVLPAEAREDLRRALAAETDEIVPCARNPELFARIAAVGIAREVGTINDELARFVFDADRGAPVARDSLSAELVEWRGHVGVRIRSRESARLEIRARGFVPLVHPDFSFNPDGTIHSLAVFPALVARVAALEGVELVLVRSWAANSIFGGFDPAAAYYQTNFWELENNDALLFADLVRRGRLALLGTHDLVAHVAGVRRAAWTRLRARAERVHAAIRGSFAGVARPTVASLVLPYTAGVVLDDLAQPPTYDSPSHALVLDRLLAEIERGAIPVDLPTVLTKFPSAFARIIEASRDPATARSPAAAARPVAEMVAEIRAASLRTG